jgi:hypothetical protein
MRQQKITLGEMRAMGVRGLLMDCFNAMGFLRRPSDLKRQHDKLPM